MKAFLIIALSAFFSLDALSQDANYRNIIIELYEKEQFDSVINKCEAYLISISPKIFQPIEENEINQLLNSYNSGKDAKADVLLFYLRYWLDSKSKIKETDHTYNQVKSNINQIAKLTNNIIYQTYGFNRIGKDLFSNGSLEESAGWFINTVEFEKKHYKLISELNQVDYHDFLFNVYTAYYRLGRIFTKLHNYEKSIQYFNKAIQYAQVIGNLYQEALSMYQLGNSWFKMSSYDSALIGYRSAKRIFADLKNEERLSAVYINIGNIYNLKNEYNDAITYYDSASIILSKIDDQSGKAYLLNNVANLQYNMDKLDEAIVSFKSSLSLARETVDNELLRANVEAIADLYREMQQYDSAFRYFYMTQDLLTETYNSQLSESIHELEIKHNTKEKEWEISRQQEIIAKKNTRLTYLLIIISLLVLISVVGWYLFRIKKRANKLLTLQKETAVKHSEEKSALMEELHHRVKNNMELISSVLNLQSHMLTDESAISAISESKGRVDAMSLIHQKLYFTDNITHVNMREYIEQLVRNIAFTFGYIDSDDIEIKMDIVDLELKVDQAIPLCIILNELITNAFKYAFTGEVDAMLNVSLKSINDQLVLRLSDNGNGINEHQQLANSSSFGLQLVNTMIKQLNAEMKTSGKNGTQYEICLKDNRFITANKPRM
ncbi:MAG: histidine kinase dimerization/phosphoacceptor domain -containing protein [Bacteroidota bacterium]